MYNATISKKNIHTSILSASSQINSVLLEQYNSHISVLDNGQIYCLLAGDHHILLLLSDRNRNNSVHIPTILNSSVSNYCFVNKDNFQLYITYSKTYFRALAEKNTKFRIFGESIVINKNQIKNRKPTNIMMKRVLHCPNFVVNLISISESMNSSIVIQFIKNHVNLFDTNEKLFIMKLCSRRMYHFSRDGLASTLAMWVKLREIAVVIDV